MTSYGEMILGALAVFGCSVSICGLIWLAIFYATV